MKPFKEMKKIEVVWNDDGVIMCYIQYGVMFHILEWYSDMISKIIEYNGFLTEC